MLFGQPPGQKLVVSRSCTVLQEEKFVIVNINLGGP